MDSVVFGYEQLDFFSIVQQPVSPTQPCVASAPGIAPQNASDLIITVSCAAFAYVTNAADDTVSAYSVDATTGALTLITTPTALGASPSAIVGAPYSVFVAKQGSNVISDFTVDPTTGALTPGSGSPLLAGTDPKVLSLSGLTLSVADAGSDTLSTFNPSTTVATGKSPSAIVQIAQFLYVANNGGSNDISAYSVLSALMPLPLPGSPFPVGGSPLGLAIGAGGRFLYTANPDATNASISGFSVDPNSGALSPLSGSPFPLPVSNYIATDQTGAYLYVTVGKTIVGYAIDPTSGALAALPGFPVAAGANAYSISVDPTNQFLYVTNEGEANISGFRLDASTGALTPLPGSPFPAGNGPQFMATF